jgi:hypothetical protein
MSRPFRLTAITPHSVRDGAWSVVADDREIATVGIDAIEHLALTVGTIVTPDLAGALAVATAARALVEGGASLLTHRAYSRVNVKECGMPSGFHTAGLGR